MFCSWRRSLLTAVLIDVGVILPPFWDLASTSHSEWHLGQLLTPIGHSGDVLGASLGGTRSLRGVQGGLWTPTGTKRFQQSTPKLIQISEIGSFMLEPFWGSSWIPSPNRRLERLLGLLGDFRSQDNPTWVPKWHQVGARKPKKSLHKSINDLMHFKIELFSLRAPAEAC